MDPTTLRSLIALAVLLTGTVVASVGLLLLAGVGAMLLGIGIVLLVVGVLLGVS